MLKLAFHICLLLPLFHELLVESLALLLEFQYFLESVCRIGEKVRYDIFKFLISFKEISFHQDEELRIVQGFSCELALAIGVTLFVDIDEIYLTEVVALFNEDVDSVTEIWQDISCLASAQEVNFVHRVSLLEYVLSLIAFHWTEKRHDESYEMRRFMLEEADAFNKILMHDN